MEIIIKRSKHAKKLYKALISANNKTHKVSFGDPLAAQYPTHKDKARRDRYLVRHKARENWTKSGILTPGFWSRWLLWNKPTLKASAKDIEKRFGAKISLLI